MKNLRLLCLLFTIASVALNIACSSAQDSPPNYILMIGDDMAIETLSCYQVGKNTADTPTLDELCDSGVRFDNFWSQPVCSPTRATLLTGQYGFTTGVGTPVTPMQDIDWSIPTANTPVTNNTGMGGMAGNNAMSGMGANSELTAQSDGTYFPDNAVTFLHALKDIDQPYQTAAVGKWHLASHTNGELEHPRNLGFDHYSGSIRGGGVTTYEGWSKVIDGSKPFAQTGYATTDTVEDGIKWLKSVDQDMPWFLWVAFNAPHTPFHMPPKSLLASELKDLDPNNPEITSKQMYNAMIEAMDTEIGRLLTSLDDKTLANTYIIFMGDNGTPNQTVSAPFESGRAKGSLYQGGINVPFMIAGPNIKAKQTSKSLVNSVDLFATILDLSNIPLANAKPKDQPFHSVSISPILHNDPNTQVRNFAYADIFGMVRNGIRDSRTIRNKEYKLILNFLDNTEELYNLQTDPYEKNNLLEASQSDKDKQNYRALKQAINDLING